jgi:hypothetical protein
MIKNIFLFTLIIIVLRPALTQSQPVSDLLTTVPQNKLKLSGHVGLQTNLIIKNRIIAQDYDYLVEPFRHKNETRLWQMEFWGKWMLGAVAAWEYTHDTELMEHMSNSVTSIIKTQLPNGYIGNYPVENQLTNWDIWGRKYVLLGLLRYHDITQDKKALKAAQKSADYLLTQLGTDKTNIIETGNYHGMAGKWYIHEESIRVPLIVYDPRVPDNQKGLTNNEMVLNIDIAPTILNYAGIDIPETMQGENIRNILYQKNIPWRNDFLFEHPFKYKTLPRSEGVVTKDWKYVRFIDRQAGYEWMFNTNTDPNEKQNLAEDEKYSAEKVILKKRFEELVEQFK